MSSNKVKPTVALTKDETVPEQSQRTAVIFKVRNYGWFNLSSDFDQYAVRLKAMYIFIKQ